MKNWLALILGLPTANATERMRAWRALKASGAAVLRDGVYLLPDTSACREALTSVERDILAINGTAYLLPVVDPNGFASTSGAITLLIGLLLFHKPGEQAVEDGARGSQKLVVVGNGLSQPSKHPLNPGSLHRLNIANIEVMHKGSNAT